MLCVEGPVALGMMGLTLCGVVRASNEKTIPGARFCTHLTHPQTISGYAIDILTMCQTRSKEFMISRDIAISIFSTCKNKSMVFVE